MLSKILYKSMNCVNSKTSIQNRINEFILNFLQSSIQWVDVKELKHIIHSRNYKCSYWVEQLNRIMKYTDLKSNSTTNRHIELSVYAINNIIYNPEIFNLIPNEFWERMFSVLSVDELNLLIARVKSTDHTDLIEIAHKVRLTKILGM